MDRKLASSVNYLQYIVCFYNAAKLKELEDRPPKQQEETYLGLPIYPTTNINL